MEEVCGSRFFGTNSNLATQLAGSGVLSFSFLSTSVFSRLCSVSPALYMAQWVTWFSNVRALIQCIATLNWHKVEYLISRYFIVVLKIFPGGRHFCNPFHALTTYCAVTTSRLVFVRRWHTAIHVWCSLHVGDLCCCWVHIHPWVILCL